MQFSQVVFMDGDKKIDDIVHVDLCMNEDSGVGGSLTKKIAGSHGDLRDTELWYFNVASIENRSGQTVFVLKVRKKLSHVCNAMPL
jgi:hypothetical protein